MNRLSYIEEAFEKVRKNSHINDTSEMVAKVLTTEIAFNDLRKIVEDSNYNILKTQEKIQEIEENLRKVEKMKNQSNLKESLQTEILEKLKTGVEDQNKLIKLKEVHQKIKVWSSKMIKKLGGSLKSPSLQENMSVIKDLLINNIESLKTSGKLSQVVEGQPVSLKQVIQSIENKDLKKIRSDSAERLLQDSEVMRELAYSTPSLDLKLKK
jgi:3-methyladenine DNA glycosylase Tag